MLRNLIDALRGGANEAAQSVVDSQGIRILEQQIRDSEAEVAKAENDLASVIADSKVTESNLNKAKEKYNSDAAKLEKVKASGNDSLLADLQARMQTTLNEHNNLKKTLDRQTSSIAQLRKLLSDNRATITNTKSQIGVLKTQDSLNSAKKSLVTNSNSTNSRLSAMKSTMARIEEKQAHESAKLDALEGLEDEASGASLDAQLDAAGFGDSVKVEDLPTSL